MDYINSTDSSWDSSSIYDSTLPRTSETEKETSTFSEISYSDDMVEQEKYGESVIRQTNGIVIEPREHLPVVPRVENRNSEHHQRIRRTRIRLTESMPCYIPIRLPEYKPIIINEEDFLEINREMLERDGIDVDKKINNVRPRVDKTAEEQKYLYEDDD